MTLEMFLKKIFGDKLNEDIDLDEGNGDNGANNTPNNGNKDIDPPPAPNIDKIPPVIIEDGWYNKETGIFDESKVKDPVVLDAIKSLVGVIDGNKQTSLINDAINAEVAKYQFNISKDNVLKLIDLSAVKVEDGKVVGVKEAFDTFKTNEPNVFKLDNAPNGGNNPLTQGFNTLNDGGVTGIPKSFAEAFDMMNE